MKKKRLVISSRDYTKLKQIIGGEGEASLSENLKNLAAELSNAIILEPEEIPPDVITMTSRVRFMDVEEDEELVFSLVYPEDSDTSQGKLSILAPIGTALLGYRVGDEVRWKVPAGLKKFRIEEIIYQPEANGDYLL